MLTITNLRKIFDRGNKPVTVVNDISLKVKRQQVMGFLGPNGAGKTTTVKMIVGLLRADSGRIMISGRPSSNVKSRQIIGFVPESPQFYRYLTAGETLEFVGSLFGLAKEVSRERAKKLLAEVGLERSANQPVGQFSKGMLQRLAFAVALINDPQLLIMDEPLDGLDPLGRLDFKRLIGNLKEQGKTVFFSSHILADVEQLADQVAILDRGVLKRVGTPKEIIGNRKASLEQVFTEIVRQSDEG